MSSIICEDDDLATQLSVPFQIRTSGKVNLTAKQAWLDRATSLIRSVEGELLFTKKPNPDTLTRLSQPLFITYNLVIANWRQMTMKKKQLTLQSSFTFLNLSLSSICHSAQFFFRIPFSYPSSPLLPIFSYRLLKA